MMTNKEQQIYDILYNLSVDETDCRECQNYYACENGYMDRKLCQYRDHFEVNKTTKEYLTNKVKNIIEIITK